MNNTKKNTRVVAAITLLLIMGTSVIPMQSFAGQHKKTNDFKSSIKASSELDKKSANQNMDQDNFCHRSDNCNQANQGQHTVGKDNEAAGFNDQSRNIQQDTTPTPNPTSASTPNPIVKTVLRKTSGQTKYHLL